MKCTRIFRGISVSFTVLFIVALLVAIPGPAGADDNGYRVNVKNNDKLVQAAIDHNVMPMRNVSSADRLAAAKTAAEKGLVVASSSSAAVSVPVPGGTPDYFGPYPNYANSPLVRKFVNGLPGLYVSGVTPIASVRNNIGQYLPVAVPDTVTYPGSDYYEISLVQYTEQLHSDLKPTTLRGYVQTNVADPLVKKPSYLGPAIIAQKDRPVRVKFTNRLPTGAGGNLFIPTDTTIMGAGMGPLGIAANPIDYTQNRATLHLHGGNTPWISDGTMHQWTTPAGENTPYPKGVSVYNVPDMDGGTEPVGTLTFYYTNQQSARLMFYHDHAYGITRLNVYAGEAAPYVLRDSAESSVVGTIPEIPLVIQDKTFLPGSAKLAAQDPTWPFPVNTSASDLWFPHVYMPNQNPGDITGANAMGRWDYGPWFWPPFTGLQNGPVANPYYDPVNAPWEPQMMPGTPNPSIVPEAFMDTPLVNGNAYPYIQVGQQAYRFRILNAANDRYFNLQLYYASTSGPFVTITGGGGTGASALASVNASGKITGITITSGGARYKSVPSVNIYDAPGHTPAGSGAAAAAKIDLNPSNATYGEVVAITVTRPGSGYSVPTVSKGAAVNPILATEVAMVPAVPGSWPNGWPTPDGRTGGWPDPANAGPSMIQIGTEGGLLPASAVIQNRPIGYDYNRRSVTVLNVLEKALFLGPAERADVIVDFSTIPSGSTLILYNDAPAPVPGFDPRYDYYTGAPDQTLTGGAPSTFPGYGPNTRTILQIRVNSSLNRPPATNYNLNNLPAAYNKTQPKPIVPQAAYNTAFKANYPVDAYARVQDTSMNFTPAGAALPVTIAMMPKSIIEDFDVDYGRMNAMLGVEVPKTSANIQTSIPYYDIDPPTEVIRDSVASAPIGTLADGTQIWKITHNGVDTHALHWHMFNVQLVNRVGWDGMIKPPDANEIGWKETIRMNPLEDIIVALRPIKPTVPFDLPNSVRPLDVTTPLGSSMPLQFHNVDPTNEPAPVVNHLVNFGWEYVWHCHLLGHEENIMMRPMAFATSPNAPRSLTGTATGPGVSLNWIDNSTSETSFTILRATNAAGPWTTITNVPVPLAATGTGTGPTKGTPYTYTDTTAAKKTTYYYRVFAANVVGDTTAYAAPATGYPSVIMYSPQSNVITIRT